MANTVLNITNGKKFNEAYEVVSNSVSADATVEFQMNDKDWKYAIIITTTSATNVTIKAPIKATPFSADDLVLALEANKKYSITIESGKFKNDTSDNYNTVVLTTDKAITVEVVKLP